MIRSINYIGKSPHGSVSVSGSKSESNRLLILKQFYQHLELENVSDSDDSKHMAKALASSTDVVDIGHAGTAMRFLTAYFAALDGREVILTGSERMQNRPIKILVDALKMLEADVEYVAKEGYPPLKIKGKKLTKNKVSIQGNVSSQYISALLLIAPTLANGLNIELVGEVTSVPYLKMSIALLNKIGVTVNWEKQIIQVSPLSQSDSKTLVVESDWSSASYFYSLVALSEHGEVKLSAYHQDSLQGDSALVDIYKQFGVSTTFENHWITLKKDSNITIPQHIDLNMVNVPDLAQTVAVTCFGLGMSCDIEGLHTLKIKETDRLVALQQELSKLGANIKVTDKSLHLKAFNQQFNQGVSIATYHDHRMAMAFAPLALKVALKIEDADVVTKSFTSFWDDFESVLS